MIAMVIQPIMIERIKKAQEKYPKYIKFKVESNKERHTTYML